MSDSELNVEEALAAAWDAQENADEVKEPTPTEVISSEQPEDAEDEVDDSQDEYAEDDSVPHGTSEPVDEPPRGLPAAAREKWAETPKEIKDAINKRSEDYSRGIQQYAQAAKRAQAYDEVTRPYQQLFAMNNVQPPQLVGQLLQTASVLQMGTQTQKATLLANMVKQFGIDIATLDSALVGEAPPENIQKQSELDQMLNQRLQPLQEQLQRYRQREMMEEQQQQTRVNSEIEAFAADPKNKYYRDVRLAMADVLDEAAAQQRPMTLNEAYEEACWRHPEIRKLKLGEQQTNVVQRKKRSASSIYGTPGGSGGNPQGGSIRDALSAAMESVGRV